MKYIAGIVIVTSVWGVTNISPQRAEKEGIIPLQVMQEIERTHNARPLIPMVANKQSEGPSWVSPSLVIAYWDFETGAMGWTATDGNSDGTTWTVGTTPDIYKYYPPDYGTQYAYYSDNVAGGSAPASIPPEVWTSPNTWINAPPGLFLSFSWGYRSFDFDDTLAVSVRFFSSGSWGGWYSLWTYGGANANGVQTLDLSSYLPADSIQIAFLYWDHGGWNWAVAVDNVTLDDGTTPMPDESTIGIINIPQTVLSRTTHTLDAIFANVGNAVDTMDLIMEIYDTTNFLYGYDIIPSFSHNPGDIDTVTFTLPRLDRGFYWIRVFHNLSSDIDNSNDTVYWHVLALDYTGYGGSNQILIVDLDPALYNPTVRGGGYAGQSGVHLAFYYEDFQYTVNWVWNEIPTNFSDYNVVMVTHGVFDYLAEIPSSLVSQMRTFLYNGGKSYAEGGDIWGYSAIWQGGFDDQLAWDSLFGVNRYGVQDGASDLRGFVGIYTSLLPHANGRAWVNRGENNLMDRLDTLNATATSLAEAFLVQDDPTIAYPCGVVFENTPSAVTYRTVAANFELAFVSQTTTYDAFDTLQLIIVRHGLQEYPILVNENPIENNLSYSITISDGKVMFSIPKPSRVTVPLIDITGRQIRTLTSGFYEKGTHTIPLNIVKVPTGIYFIRLETPEFATSQKTLIVKQ